MFVSDMDLNWLHSVKGHSLGKGLTLASFQMRGIHCCSIERLDSLVIIGAKTCEKSFHIANMTAGSSKVGTRVPTGINIGLGDM